MQLKHSPAEKAFVQSIQAEIKSGKPPKQAPAYAAQKQATRKQPAAKKR
jgi:hypothetical protein